MRALTIFLALILINLRYKIFEAYIIFTRLTIKKMRLAYIFQLIRSHF